MKVTVGLKQLKIVCFIGILEEEKRKKQPIFIDVSCAFDLEELRDTLDYAILKELCEKTAASKKYDLLEELAYDIIQEIKKRREKVLIKLCIQKPGAFSNADYAYAMLEENGK